MSQPTKAAGRSEPVAARERRAREGQRQMVLLLVDLLLLSLGLWLVLELHPYVPMSELARYPVLSWLRWWLVLWAVWLPVASSIGLYNLRLAGDPDRAIVFALFAWTVTSLVYSVIPVIAAPLFYRRWLWLVFFAAIAVALGAWRGAYALLWTRREPWRLALLGRPRGVEEIAGRLGESEDVRLAGVYAISAADAATIPGSGIPATLQQYQLMLNSHAVDELAVDDTLCALPAIEGLIARSVEQSVIVSSLSACTEMWLGHVTLDPALVEGWIASLAIRKVTLRLHEAFRRIVDLLVALLCLPLVVIAGPVLWCISLAGRRRLALERTLCVGRRGRTFVAYSLPAEWAPAVQRLPLLWNLARGNVTLLGPRILPHSQVEELATLGPFLGLRGAVRPGVVGWAQTRVPPETTGSRASAELPYDLYYVLHRGIALDLAIVYHYVRPARR